MGPSFFKDIEKELFMVEEELKRQVGAEMPVLNRASAHLLSAGGKRLRPAFALLAARFFSEEVDRVIPLAAALELIHMATLVHDDIVDASDTRRGQPTVRAHWGDQLSLYTGNYLFARSLILIANYPEQRIAQILAMVSEKMCEGEIFQIVTAYDLGQGVRGYLYRIRCKTALLISASCALGALAAGASPRQARALGAYGYHLGMAFQVTDDILDFIGDPAKMGKPVGSDVRQGIITLPALLAMQVVEGRRFARLLTKREKSEEDVGEIITVVKESGAISASMDRARRYIRRAIAQLNLLDAPSHQQILRDLGSFVVSRNR